MTLNNLESTIFIGEKTFKGPLQIDTTLGSEKVTNGSFTGAATGWTLGAAWAYNANAVDKNADGTTTLSQNVSAVANEIYRVTYTISGWSVGTVTVSIGGVSGTARGVDGTYTEYIAATGTGNLIFTPTNTARFTVDGVSVKRVAVVAADRVTMWAADRLASGVEAAGDAGLFVRSEDGTLAFIGDTTQLGGALLINATAAYGRLGQLLEVNQSANNGGMALNTWSATAGEGAVLDLNRSKSATIGTQTIVASGDTLGVVVFRGSDGAAYQDAAYILGAVDGTPGLNDMPGRLQFFTTPDGSPTSIERMRINSDGSIQFGAIIDVASTTDLVKLGTYDLSDGNRTLALATETAVAVGAGVASTHTLSIRINGTTYKVLLSNV